MADQTIGLRCPDDYIATEMLSSVPHAVVASSANVAGAVAPRCGGDVLRDLDGQIDLLIDGGSTKYAKPSITGEKRCTNAMQPTATEGW